MAFSEIPFEHWDFARTMCLDLADWIGGLPEWVKAGIGFALPVVTIVIYVFR